MEAKINIAEILESKSQGTKLYSLTYGDCFYQEYTGDFGIECQSQNGVQFNLDEYGKYCIDGECILFPSKEMRDWGKFAWKKGDVLVNKDGDVHIIFERFVDDTYCSFVGKYYLWKENNDTEQFYEKERLLTSDFQKAGKDVAQTYINTIEERLGGKLNRETLNIEKQTEFKDGDIVFEEGNRNYCSAIGVLKKDEQGCFMFDTFLTKDKVCYNSEYIYLPIRLATEEEKKQLFSALAKEGKQWDSEKKMIVDLKPKCEFKPFDRCIWKIRNCEVSIWQASFVSYVDEYGATPMGVSIDEDLVNLIILPYNDQTKLLVGTTDEWKGGEQ